MSFFYLNGVLVATHFNKGKYGKVATCTIIFWLGLKEFLDNCVKQFHVYVWFATHRHHVYNFLD